MRSIVSTLLFFLGIGLAFAGKNTIAFDHSVPSTGSNISSFDNITLVFDISKIQEAYPQYDKLGICSTAIEDYDPEWANAIILYKGKPNEGNILASLYETRTVTSPNFEVGNEYTFGFPSIVIEDGQEYTVKIFYSFKVGQQDLSSNELSTLTKESVLSLDYFSSIDLTFVGQTKSESLTLTGIEPASGVTLDLLNDILLSFNTNISIAEGAYASLIDNGQPTDNIGSLNVGPNNELLISFDNVPLYKTHTYNVVLNEGAIISDLGTSQKYELDYIGDSWNYFTIRRGQYPTNNSEVIEVGSIYIPFDFPDGYGFKATSGTPPTYTANLYKGGQDGELVGTYVLENSSAGNAIEGNIDALLDTGTAYTIVIPEGQLTIRNLNGVGALEGWTNGEIVINLTTPAEEAINKVELQGTIPTSGKHLEEFTMTLMPYTYDSTSYATVLAENAAIILYENEEEVAKFPVEIATVDNSSVLRNKEPMNTVLAAGKNYKVVLPAGTVAPDHAFLGKYGANKEMSFVVEGKMPATVELSYVISEGASMKTTLSGGSKATFKAEAPENWVVESVNFNGEPMEAVNGEYTTPAIEDDATVTVVYAFDGEIQFVDLSTGVEDVTIGDSDYTVGKDGVYVVIKGLTSGDNVTIYTVNGQTVGQHTANLDTLKIELPAGMYIIRVNNVTFKIQH